MVDGFSYGTLVRKDAEAAQRRDLRHGLQNTACLIANNMPASWCIDDEFRNKTGRALRHHVACAPNSGGNSSIAAAAG
jgi:hypothetical protein